MFSFFSNKEKENLSIIFDIQSGLVRGALILNKGNEPTRVLRVVTRSIPHKSHTNGSYLTKMMLKALSETGEILSLQIKRSPKTIHYVLSSPWVFSQSKTLTLHFEKDTEITDKLVTSFVEEERRRLEEKSKITNSDLSFIEQKIFEIKLNGYKVTTYEGKEARSLDISFAATLSSKKLLNRIHTTINKALHSKSDVCYHSALLLNFLAMRSLVPEKDNFVEMHVHSELTDVVVVKNGLSAHLASFPFGTSTLLRKLESSLKESPETTDSTLHLFIDGKLESAQQEKTNSHIKPILQHWYDEYIKSSEHRDDDLFLPKTVYISSHDYLALFKSVIKENNKMTQVNSFETTSADMHVIFDKTSEYNQLVGMYALALRSMV